MIVLAADVGGTNSRFALFHVERGEYRRLREDVLPSDRDLGFPALAKRFLSGGSERPDIACLGVAGPVREGHVRATNLPWELDEAELARDLEIPRVLLINDLEATGWSLDGLDGEALETLHEGVPGAQGNRVIVAAGTGLGVGVLTWDGRAHHVSPSEGGHVGFAPATEMDRALSEHLGTRYERVSWERLVSGPGLFNIFEFLISYRRLMPAPETTAAMQHGDAAAVIVGAAQDGTCALSADALDAFVRYYGMVAGDLALVTLARGGVYLAGGMAPRILAKLRDGGFMRAFLAKGRMSGVVTAMPVRVVLDTRAALLGAARRAAAHAAGDGP